MSKILDCPFKVTAVAVLTLTGPVAVIIVTERTLRSTKTRGQQDAVDRAGGAGVRPLPTAGVTRVMAS